MSCTSTIRLGLILSEETTEAGGEGTLDGMFNALLDDIF